MPNLKDFATGIVVTAPSPLTTGTTLTVESGKASRFPATPFSAVAHPEDQMPTLDNAEKVTVTDIEDDTLTITRAQGSTTAKEIQAGWRISNAIFVGDFINSSDANAVLLLLSGATLLGDLDLDSNRLQINATAYIDGSSAGEIILDGTLIADKLMQIDAATGNPEFNFKEAGSTRGKVYYDVANNRLVFQNNENNNADAIYFADPITTSGNVTVGGNLLMSNYATLAASIGNLLMPVGHIYISGVATNPNTLLGFGTWARIEGQFIAGVSDSDTDFDLDDTGGAKTHTHEIEDNFTSTYSASNGWAYTNGGTVANGKRTSDAGSSLPPFIAKYIWQRTA